ncbi:hypothetical protein [Paraburkholderia bonniea]|uniref:hypothetical protein n=1 Tax=Paraburkholderia bonniea TaxID=2152891 RepID=UPI00129235E3|nr:hypothetical protein [Paraburkholderia bonniea]
MKLWNKTSHSLIANLLAGGMLLSANSAFAQVSFSSQRVGVAVAIYGDPYVSPAEPLRQAASHASARAVHSVPAPDYRPRF